VFEVIELLSIHSFSLGGGGGSSCHPCVQHGAETTFSRTYMTACVFQARFYTDVHVNPESGAIGPCS